MGWNYGMFREGDWHVGITIGAVEVERYITNKNFIGLQYNIPRRKKSYKI
jgi:hypothetical protein